MKDYKKVLTSIIVSVAAMVSLSACSQANGASRSSTAASIVTAETSDLSSSANESAGDIPTQDTGKGNILIAYFTLPMEDGVDAVSRASRKQSDDGTFGNIMYMAHVIQKNAGGELFSIETAQKYPTDNMDDLLEFAAKEKSEDARPELSTHIENLDDYDTVFIGYPNWNTDLPMPMYSFFEEYDFSGKTIIPFVAHGGSGASRTVSTIKELEPGATVIDDPVTVYWDELDNAESIVTEWVQNLEY